MDDLLDRLHQKENEIARMYAALEAAYRTIIRLTQRDRNECIEDRRRGVCSFLEAEARERIFLETTKALETVYAIGSRDYCTLKSIIPAPSEPLVMGDGK